MTIKELITQLQELDPELEVLVAKSTEGDRITVCEGWATGNWNEEEDEFVEADEIEEYVPGEVVNSVVLYPY